MTTLPPPPAEPGVYAPLIDWQWTVQVHPARTKNVNGGRGIWKTRYVMPWLTAEVMASKYTGEGWHTFPNYAQAKRSAWEDWNTFLEEQPTRIKLSENSTDLLIRLINKKAIRLVGMDNYQDLRSGHPIAVGNDERAYAKAQGYVEVVDPAGANKQAKVLNVTTPRGNNHWRRTYNLGVPGPNQVPDTMSWTFTQPEVGTISVAELARYQPGGDLEMSPDLYRQEWLAEFLEYEGLVFPEWISKVWPEGHFMSQAEWMQVRGSCYHFGSMDWGFADKTVLLWLAKTPQGRLIAYKELSINNRTPAQIVAMARAQCVEPDKLPQIVYLDPSAWSRESDGKSVAEKFMLAGLRCLKADNRFQAGVEHLRTMMAMERLDTQPFFMIVQGTCPETSGDFALLDDLQLAPAGGGFKKHAKCHGADAARYGAMSMYTRGRHIPQEAAAPKRGPAYLPWLQSEEGRDQPQEPELNPLTGTPI